MFGPGDPTEQSAAVQWLADTAEHDAILRWASARRSRRELRDLIADAARRADCMARLEASLSHLRAERRFG